MLAVRDKRADDTDRLKALWTEHFGAPVVVARGRKHDPMKLPGFVAEEDGKLLGAVTFLREEDEIEVITLDSAAENRGAGTALLEAVAALAREQGVWRLCLVTTNDNIRAIRFYQKRGWNLCAFYRDALLAARKLKPQIPMLGEDGIPIRHEIEFELRL
jgi:N-acetylglutamate synthase-like GNAT family acetyltransferase